MVLPDIWLSDQERSEEGTCVACGISQPKDGIKKRTSARFLVEPEPCGRQHLVVFVRAVTARAVTADGTITNCFGQSRANLSGRSA